MKLRKLTALALAASMVAAMLTGCSGSSSSAPAATEAAKTEAAPTEAAASEAAPEITGDKVPSTGKTVTLKLGHITNTVHPYHKCAELLAEELKERTNGEVILEVYPSSQLGSQRELIEGLQMGSVDFVLTGTSILSGFCPSVSVVDFPFLFRDKEHAYHTLDGEVGQEIFSGIDNVGIFLAAWENGWRVFFNAKHPIHTPDDMKDLKLRCQDSEIMVDIFTALGATATPMALGELYSALQQKTVDGADNTIASLYSDKAYEVTNYLTMTQHCYSPSVAIMSNYTVDKLSPEQLELVKELFVKYRDIEREMNAEQDQEALDDMMAQGMEVYYPTPEERELYVEKVQPVWDKYMETVGGRELVDKILAVE